MESGKIIVVANQKGGVAKTSTVRNLSYALAEMGKKVLVVDFDPQYNLTTSFGVLPTQAPYNTGTLITNLLLDESLPDTNEFIQKIGSVDLIPSSRSLTVAEANLLMTPDSNDYLAALLNPLRLSYEIPVFHKALSECGSLEVRPVAICVPQEIQEYCMELFGEDVQIAAASHDLFAKRANGQIYRPLVEKYIAGEKRL